MTDVDVPHFWELDYLGDLKLFQHPPCMFILWWLGLGINGIWDIIEDLLKSDGGGSDSKPKPAQSKGDEKPEEEGKKTGDDDQKPAETVEPPEDGEDPFAGNGSDIVVTDPPTDDEEA